MSSVPPQKSQSSRCRSTPVLDQFANIPNLALQVQMADESRISEAGSSESLPITEDSIELETQGTKKRKAIEPRSKVWEHFNRYKENGVWKASCKYCKHPYTASTTNGTTGLRGHLSRCQDYPPNKIETTDTQAKLTFQTSQKGDSSLGNWKFDQELVRRALVEMIIVDELPFSFVEKEGFKKFMSKSQSFFKIPSRRTLTRDCYKIYDEERQILKRFFRDVQPKICLTTDTWTSVQRINYMCLTAHFIDRDWVLHKRILNFCPISSHKGEDMAEAINNCLLDWCLDNVFTITVDNASSNDVTVREVCKQLNYWGTNMMEGKHLHVRCMAHILNLIVQDGLKEIGGAVKRVRQMVRYIRQSPGRLRYFKECVERKKIEYNKALCLDVPTRWNSTYLMLEIAQHYESAFHRFDLNDGALSTYLTTHVCEDGSVAGKLQYDDWINVRNVVKFLERFYNLTVKVSGSRYVTCNVHFEEICELSVYLKACVVSEDTDLSKMATEMQKKFTKYWGDPFKMNKMIFIASVLDPRNKYIYVDFALEEMFGVEKGRKIKVEVSTYLNSLFGEYVKKYSRGIPQSPSTPNETSSDSNASGVSVVRNKLQMKRQKEDSGSTGAKSELEKYLNEDQEPIIDNFDILDWWRVNSPRFPVLSELARDVLAIPISSVASECAFSTGGRILDSFRSSLTPKLVQALVCVQDWLRGESLPINVEENLDYLEQLEAEMANNGRGACIVDV